MLSLEILPASTAAQEPPLDPHAPEVAVWRDLDGRPCALGEVRAEAYYFHLLGVATFSFRPDSDHVRAVPMGQVADEIVVDQFYRTVVPLALQNRGYGALHASAVRTPQGVVALCARKESGKSTLAFALVRRGHEPWADDAVIFRVGERGAETFAVPFRIRLRPEPKRHFASQVGAGELVVERRIEIDPTPLRALVVLERSRSPVAEPGVAARRLESGVAFRAVLEHAYCFRLEGPGKRELVEQYLGLVARVPVYELRYGSGLERLPLLVETIEQLAGASLGAAGDPA